MEKLITGQIMKIYKDRNTIMSEGSWTTSLKILKQDMKTKIDTQNIQEKRILIKNMIKRGIITHQKKLIKNIGNSTTLMNKILLELKHISLIG